MNINKDKSFRGFTRLKRDILDSRRRSQQVQLGDPISDRVDDPSCSPLVRRCSTASRKGSAGQLCGFLLWSGPCPRSLYGVGQQDSRRLNLVAIALLAASILLEVESELGS